MLVFGGVKTSKWTIQLIDKANNELTPLPEEYVVLQVIGASLASANLSLSELRKLKLAIEYAEKVLLLRQDQYYKSHNQLLFQ
jgi:hypothetical protein